MSEQDWLAEQFEVYRNHLQMVAYRMLGSLSEADDAVQESWLRLSRSDTHGIENLRGWLTTVVSRVCLDMLRSRKARREESLGTQLPETLARYEDSIDPEQEALLAESVGLAFLVLLDNLNPSERVAFVLHEAFDIPFTEIAAIVGKSEAATRQIASRARRRVRGARGIPEADLAGHREIVDGFIAAARIGDFDSIVAALDPDVVLRDDRQIGSSSVTRGAIALAKQISGRAKPSQSALVNGSVGAIAAPCGRLLYVLEFTIRHGKITEVDLISNPTRIRQLDLAVLGG